MENIDALQQYFNLLTGFQPQERAVDHAHNLFLMGALLSRKPQQVLELGIGTGFVSWTLLRGLQFNGTGHLTCVDNFIDWDGQLPAGLDQLVAAGVKVVGPIDEGDFLRSCPSDAYDFVIS